MYNYSRVVYFWVQILNRSKIINWSLLWDKRIQLILKVMFQKGTKEVGSQITERYGNCKPSPTHKSIRWTVSFMTSRDFLQIDSKTLDFWLFTLVTSSYEEQGLPCNAKSFDLSEVIYNMSFKQPDVFRYFALAYLMCDLLSTSRFWILKWHFILKIKSILGFSMVLFMIQHSSAMNSEQKFFDYILDTEGNCVIISAWIFWNNVRHPSHIIRLFLRDRLFKVASVNWTGKWARLGVSCQRAWHNPLTFSTFSACYGDSSKKFWTPNDTAMFHIIGCWCKLNHTYTANLST